MATFLLFISHYIADFIFQSRQMGENKSSSHRWLLKHVVVYATVLGLLTFPLFENEYLFACWLFGNFMWHWGVDYVTSRFTKRLYEQKKMHAFWCVIGMDQMIHYLTLFYSFQLFNG